MGPNEQNNQDQLAGAPAPEPNPAPVPAPTSEQPVQASPPTPAVAPAAPQPQPQALGVPDSWPGAFGAYKFSKSAVMLNLGPILVMSLIVFILGGGMQTAISNRVGDSLVSLLVSSFTTGGLVVAYLGGVSGNKIEVGDSFSAGVKYFVNMLLLQILTAIALFISIIAFIIPFFFVFPRLVLSNYFLVDKNMGPVDALKASWDATKGHVGKVYGIVGASIAMALLVITIIGIPFAIYFLFMYSAVLAVLYLYIQKVGPAQPQVPAAAPTPPQAAAPPAATPPAAA